MTSINPSFGNNFNKNINSGLNKFNAQAKPSTSEQQFNLSLNQQKGDSVSFSKKGTVVNEKPIKRNAGYEIVTTWDGRRIQYPTKGWRGFVRFSLNAIGGLLPFGSPSIGDMVTGKDVTRTC